MIWAGLLLCALAVGTTPRPVALVIGANGAPAGRQVLRYAYDDAQAVATVLRELGGFAPSDVQVLHDPTPAGVEQALGRAQAEGPVSVLLFYYSGHADADALYPAGQRLPLRTLQQRLAEVPAQEPVPKGRTEWEFQFSSENGAHSPQIPQAWP